MIGFVWIVGAGPGDVRLLTLKAKECLERADVVVYDRLVTPSILSFVRPDAELIYVGKEPGKTRVSQGEVNALLIAKAKEGKRVVRLKNGDPFVFGRGAEEAEALAAAGIPFEIVPGISSVFAVPAYAGIPLTDRRFSSSFAVAVGHNASGKISSLHHLSRAETIVLLMAIGELARVVAELLAGGKDPKTPAALVEWGATPKQRTIVAPLKDIVGVVHRQNIRPPAVFIVGEVVRLREQIQWYERKPLFGKRVLVTRAEGQEEVLAGKLEEQGAEVIRMPLIKFLSASDETTLERAVDEALSGVYDWVIFTSTHGVQTFFERVNRKGFDARALAKVRFAVVGPATREALRGQGIHADLMPETYTTEALAQALVQNFPEGEKVRCLLWRAHGAREVLARRLRERGVEVTEVHAYRVVPNPLPSAYLNALLKDPIHIVTFTSPSTVHAFFVVLGEEKAQKILGGATIAVIGPVTEEACRERGLVPEIVATEHTIDGLVMALVAWASGKRCR